MPKAHSPRHGSLQVWPRVRAKRAYARVRSWIRSSEAKPLGFAGYKAGMTRIAAIDNRKHTMTKNTSIVMPVTIIECPPLKVCGIVGYKHSAYGTHASSLTLSPKLDKELARKISIPKNKQSDVKDADEYRLLVHTQPSLTGLNKKKPEVFEIALGGKKDEQLAYAKEKLGQELKAEDVFAEGEQVDVHAITKGKGFQGTTKRNRTGLRAKKSEKGQRGPANLGAWTGNRSWTVAHPGQMGYHQRTEFNKWVLKMGQDPKEVTIDGGFVRFGNVKTNYVMVKGSIHGPKKRLVRFNKATRPNPKLPNQPPQITFINTSSQQ